MSRAVGVFDVALLTVFAYLLAGPVRKESVALVSRVVGLFGIALLT